MNLFRVTFSNHAHGESLVKTALNLRISSPEMNDHHQHPTPYHHPPSVTTRANDSNAAEGQETGKAGRWVDSPTAFSASRRLRWQLRQKR